MSGINSSYWKPICHCSLVCAKTRKYPTPDPKFSGFLMSDLRNLKFYFVKPGPIWTRTQKFNGMDRQKLQIIIYLSRVQNSSSSKTILTLLELGLDLLKPTYPFLINNRFSDPIGIDLKMILHSKFTRFFTKAWQISLICIWNFLKKGL